MFQCTVCGEDDSDELVAWFNPNTFQIEYYCHRHEKIVDAYNKLIDDIHATHDSQEPDKTDERDH
jgi:hypothetical protein